MGTVTLVQGAVHDDGPVPRPGRRLHHPKSIIRGHNGTRIVLPFAPLPVDHSGFGPTWTQLSRGAARDPLLVDGDGQIRVAAYTLLIAHRGQQEPINDVLRALEKIVRTKERVSWSYGRSESGVWLITSFSYSVTARRNGNNEPTRATAQITMSRVRAAGSKPGHGSGGGGGTGGRTYVVKRGDTLWKLAHRFYGEGKKWKIIGDANHIRRPRKELKPGRKLKIPRLH